MYLKIFGNLQYKLILILISILCVFNIVFFTKVKLSTQERRGYIFDNYVFPLR